MPSTAPILDQFTSRATAATNGASDRVATDKDTFLKLLVAQLTHQDPLNPVEDKEFIAQLAQFTSVEELQNINAGITGLNEAYGRQQVTNASSLLGMTVQANGDMVTIAGIGTDGASSSPITITYPEEIAGATLNVYAVNPDGSIGKLVYSESSGPANAGSFPYQWHGRGPNGQPMPDGQYIVNVSAVDTEGNNVLVETDSSGLVVMVETSPDGNHKLILSDGREVLFNNVEIIAYIPQSNVPGGSDGSGDGSGGAGDGSGGAGGGSGDGSGGAGDGSGGAGGGGTPPAAP